MDRPLPPKGQRWVTACLLARVNAFAIADSISLRGVAPELTISQDEALLYPVQEGAFYGNLFADGDDIDWNACRGKDQAAGESGGLGLRDCTEEDLSTPGRTQCGFKYAGDCADYTPESPSPFACRSFDPEEGTYSDCHTKPGTGNGPRCGLSCEVITVYVGG